MVGAVGILLRFERQRFAVAQRFAVFAVRFAVEEVAAVELHGGLVGQHLDRAARSGFPDRGRRLDAVRGLAVEDPVVVVARAVAQLLVVGADALADGVRLAEVEGRARDVGDLSGGDQHRIDRRGVAGIDGHDVVEDRAVTLALEVEEGVVREIHHGRLVGRGAVINPEFVFGRERVGHLDLQVARKTLLSVGVEVLHHQLVFRGRNYVPDHAVQAVDSAVERLAVVVDRQVVLRAVERETSLGDAVGVGSHDRAEEAFAVIVDVTVDRLVAEHDVFVVARAVGSPERYDAGAVVGDLHGHVARAERVDSDGFAVRLRLEGFVAEEGDFRLLASAGGQQQGA